MNEEEEDIKKLLTPYEDHKAYILRTMGGMGLWFGAMGQLMVIVMDTARLIGSIVLPSWRHKDPVQDTVADQVAEHTEVAQVQQEKTLSIATQARNLRSCAKFLERNRLTPNPDIFLRVSLDHAEWLKSISSNELDMFMNTDLETIAKLIEGKIDQIPGIRNHAHILAGTPPQNLRELKMIEVAARGRRIREQMMKGSEPDLNHG